MADPRDTRDLNLTELYLLHVAESHQREIATYQEVKRMKLRLLRQDPRRDDETLNDMAWNSPTVKMKIGAQRFAERHAVMYGFGAIIESLTNAHRTLKKLSFIREILGEDWDR